MKKIILTSLALSLFLIILASALASAEFWACFNKGEIIDYCNPKVPDRTCASNMGCQYCISNYNESGDCYNGGNWMVCMGITPDCSDIGGNHTIDTSPPNLTLNSPEQDGLYTSRSVLIDFTTNEEADVYYLDNINGRGRWIRVCQECLSYSHSRSFNDGLNDITFRAVDVLGNEAFTDRQFLVDSRKPQIHKAEPRNGFASGLFEIQYTEENLKNITINYGNYVTGFQQAELSGCTSGSRQWCSINLNLAAYNNQEISYYFRVEDVAGNFKESQPKNLDVDTVFPVLNNNPHFWLQGEGRDNKYIYFSFNITEENLDDISYIDWSERTPRWRTLCSRLDEDGICEKKKSFRRGFHSLDIQITDEAGNAISTPKVEFTVV